jgi:lipopolysaccharide export system protein LptA
MIRIPLRMALIGAALLLGPAASLAKGPVDVEANSMEIIDANKQAIFKGTVKATREGERMQADEMIVNYAEVKRDDGTSSTDVTNLDAKGNVTITTKTQVITGDAARMDVTANKLVVTGNVKVVQGKTVLLGPKLDVDLNTNRTLMSGGRVKGTFVPK